MEDYIDTAAENMLTLAHNYAQMESGCQKVQVGCVITQYECIVALGTNRAIPDLCKVRGCLREELYGNNSKVHRNPSDCRAIHSEIDAICHARQSLVGATIYVTRYPCEACARAIIAAGIAHVVYGRTQEITEETRKMFEDYNIECCHMSHWTAPDDVR